jgi:leader peptidase (prepilin peptidase)/N-methyltransferase
MPILSAIIGLVVGAFIAHVAEAVLVKRTLDSPACPYCQASYSPWQWSATLGLISGHWHCSECDETLRLPRLVAEVLLAAAWGALIARYGLTLRSVFAMLVMIPLDMVMVTDLEQRLIPNAIMFPSIAAMLGLGLLFGPAVPGLTSVPWWHVPFGGLIGFFAFWVLATVGVAIFGEGALGAGDVKLAAYLGLVVGFPLVIEALILTFFLGGIGALLFLITQRGSLRSAIPYGPFLVLGTLVTILFGLDILYWYLGV